MFCQCDFECRRCPQLHFSTTTQTDWYYFYFRSISTLNIIPNLNLYHVPSNSDYIYGLRTTSLKVLTEINKLLYIWTYLWLGAQHWWRFGHACSLPHTGTCRRLPDSGCWLSAVHYSPEPDPVRAKLNTQAYTGHNGIRRANLTWNTKQVQTRWTSSHA